MLHKVISPANDWVTPQLSGFVCTYHPAAPGLSPKHTIYAFSFIVFVLYLSFEKNENKHKEVGFGPFFKTKFNLVYLLRKFLPLIKYTNQTHHCATECLTGYKKFQLICLITLNVTFKDDQPIALTNRCSNEIVIMHFVEMSLNLGLLTYHTIF